MHLDWWLRRPVGDRKMWVVHERQHLVQPMLLRRGFSREVRMTWWRWRPWLCAFNKPSGVLLKIFMPPL